MASYTKIAGGSTTYVADFDNLIDEIEVDVTAIEAKTDFITVNQNVDLDAIEAKTDFITVSQNVDLDAIESVTELISITEEFDVDSLDRKLIKNNSFENGFNQWTQNTAGGGTITLDTTYNGSGSNSVKLAIGVGETCYIESDIFDIISYVDHTFELISSSTAPVAPFNIYLLRYNSANSLLSTEGLGPLSASETIPIFGYGSLLIPAAMIGAAVRVKIRIEAYDIGSPTNVYIDTVNVGIRTTAFNVGIADTGGFYTGDNVNAVLQELGSIPKSYNLASISSTPSYSLAYAIVYNSAINTITPTIDNKIAGRQTTIIIENNHVSNPLTIVYDGSWNQVVTLPTSLAVGEKTLLRVVCVGNSDTDIYIDGGAVF